MALEIHLRVQIETFLNQFETFKGINNPIDLFRFRIPGDSR